MPRPRLSHLLTAALLLATAALVLAPRSDALGGRARVQMTVWGMPFEDRLFLDRYARRYETLTPSVAVDYRRYADVKTKYNAWHAQGRGSDLMRIEMTWYHDFVRRGLIEPLGKYIRDPRVGLPPEQLDKIPPHIRAALDVDGEIYALPMDSSVYGLYYNLDIFERYNAEHPDAPLRLPDASWTWDDLRRAAKALATHSPRGEIERRGFDFAVWAWPFLTLLAQAGGEAWSADGQTCLIDSPAGEEALRLLRAMQREDRSFAPTLGSYTAGTGADVLFGSGRTAMMLDGSWRVPNLELNYPDLRFAVAPLPKGKRRGVVTGAVMWAVSANSRHKDEAWAMLRWLVQDEQAAAYWDTLRVAPPANLAVLASPAFHATAGVLKVPGDPASGYEVPPMRPEEFNAKAAWITDAFTQDPREGRAPGFLWVSEFQFDLYNEIDRTLREFLRPGSPLSEREVLASAARSLNSLIDRTRASRGLPPVRRDPAPR